MPDHLTKHTSSHVWY